MLGLRAISVGPGRVAAFGLGSSLVVTPPAPPTLVRIRDVAKGGAGVGHTELSDAAPDDAPAEDADRRTWFVEGALPGELVRAVAHKAKRKVVRAAAVEVVEASDDRVVPPCPLATRCGGCDWQHVAPQRQAELKQSIVAGQLRRLQPRFEATAASPSALGYRRRARLHYRRDGDHFELGFHRRNTHEIENHEHCPVLAPELDAAVQRLRDVADALLPAGEVHALSDGVRVVIGLPGMRPDKVPMARFEALLSENSGLVGIVFRGGRKRETIGRAELSIDAFAGQAPLRAGPFAFTQAQAEQNEALVKHVARVAKAEGKELLELFAGGGNFTRALAKVAKHVFAVDDSREAIASLRRMASHLKLPVDAKAAQVDKVLPTYGAPKSVDVIVLDPPRGGVGKKGAAAIARLVKERIVYVSCDPATLNRDLEIMMATRPELRLKKVRVFDMMPMTSECETVAVLEAGR